MTEANVALARALWDEGVLTSEIGRRVGTTKHAIVGYAHRNAWPPRPSPLGRRRGEVREAVPRLSDKPHHRGAPTPRKRPEREVVQGRRETCKPEPLGVPTGSFQRCQWPTTSGRPWAFCGAPVARCGGAWCEAHWVVVYTRSPRQELVAA